MLSASQWQPHLLHVSAVDRRQTWSMDKSWRCVPLSGFLHSHTVRCRWNPISCGMHYSGPGLSENNSAVTTDVCEDQNREVGLWGLPLSGIDHRSRFYSALGCGTVYCNRPSVADGRCVSITTITWNCGHRSSGKGSNHLQLIRFWLSRTPGLWPYYNRRAVFAHLWVIFHFH